MADLHPMDQTLAQTGTAELHHDPVPTAIGINAPGWVALSMLVVIGIMLWRGVPRLVARALDARIDTIRQQLDDAGRLRAEAEAQLAQAKASNAASSGDGEAIVAHARAEAAAMLAKADADTGELLARRAAMAQDKIAAAERAATAAIRAEAAQAAAEAAGAILAARHDAGADRALVDRTIAGLGRPN